MRNHLGTYVRRLLHAFAEAGYQPPAQDLQPLISPNGAVMWTETTPAPRQPSSQGLSTSPEELAVPKRSHAGMDVLRPEPAGNGVSVPAAS
jgi:hypothetical protein